MNAKQRQALMLLAKRFSVPFIPEDFLPRFDLPSGWVAGWVGPIYVGCSPEGEVHS